MGMTRYTAFRFFYLEENSLAAILDPTDPRPNGSGSGGKCPAAGGRGFAGTVGVELEGLLVSLAAGVLVGDGLAFGLG